MSLLRGIRRVVIGMSGGVDSAVGAAVLKSQGYDVLGVHMQNWDEADESGDCLREREAELNDAKEACDHLGIPFTTVSFVKEYWNDVFSTLLADYERGWTPNPDVLCNRFLKFGSFYNYAKEELGADLIATGHYAQTTPCLKENANGRVRLKRAVDATKDQTLFLSSIHQKPLSQTIFPLGTMYKCHVRRMAAELGMKTLAKKRDSVGICFIGSRTFTKFISDYIPNRPGPFIDLDTGANLGSHKGVHHFTIGQRCRLATANERLYVIARDPETQIIYAAKGRDHPLLYSTLFTAEEPHWICDVPTLPLKCVFKFQHTDWTIPALVFPQGKGIKVWLSFPTRAITPGQVAVFYDGTICLGSAKIKWTDALEKVSSLMSNSNEKEKEQYI